MKQCIILCLFSIAFNCFQLKGQVVFDNVYDNDSLDDFAQFVIQTFDGGYITGNYTSSFSGDNLNGTLIIKTNNFGDTSFIKFYNFSQQGGKYADGNSIIQLEDSSYVICGIVADSLENASDSYLLKLNTSGEIIWYQQIEGGFNDKAYDVKQTADGGFIIVGYNFDSTGNTSKISLIKTDSNGNKQWQQLYGPDSTYSFSNSIFITNDGGFIIGGETEDPNCGWCLKIYMIKTDSLGNLEWEKQYGHPLGQKWGYAVPTQDGGYIISGRKKYLDTLYYGYVIKTDDTGKVVWEKEYGEDSYFKGFKRIIQLADGSYLAAGDNQHYDSVVVRNSNAWLVKLDSAGNELWSKTYTHYGDTTQDYLEDISLTNDGGFVFCGYIIGSTSMSNDVWLVKTDCEGNADVWDSIGCPLTTGIPESEIYNSKSEILIYPNPFSTTATLVILNGVKNPDASPALSMTFTMYDVLGREVKNIPLAPFSSAQANAKGEYKIQASDLPSGIYFYQVIRTSPYSPPLKAVPAGRQGGDRGVVARGKLVKQ